MASANESTSTNSSTPQKRPKSRIFFFGRNTRSPVLFGTGLTHKSHHPKRGLTKSDGVKLHRFCWCLSWGRDMSSKPSKFFKGLVLMREEGILGTFLNCRSFSAEPCEKFRVYRWWKKSCTSWYGKNPIIYRVLYIPGGAGFLPSTIMRALIWEVYFHFPLYFNTVHLYVWTDSLIFSSPGVRVDPYDVKHLTVTPVIKWSYSWGSLNIKVFHAMSLNPFWVTTSPTPRSHRNAGSESFHWEMLL